MSVTPFDFRNKKDDLFLMSGWRLQCNYFVLDSNKLFIPKSGDSSIDLED
jgi:hypothetical protein